MRSTTGEPESDRRLNDRVRSIGSLEIFCESANRSSSRTAGIHSEVRQKKIGQHELIRRATVDERSPRGRRQSVERWRRGSLELSAHLQALTLFPVFPFQLCSARPLPRCVLVTQGKRAGDKKGLAGFLPDIFLRGISVGNNAHYPRDRGQPGDGLGLFAGCAPSAAAALCCRAPSGYRGLFPHPAASCS